MDELQNNEEKHYYYARVKPNPNNDLKWIKYILTDLTVENMISYGEYQKLLKSLAN